MTSFLTGGLGGISSQETNVDQSALKGIDSTKQSFVNKDFVKNIQWLNQSVDTLSQYSQKLQSGVDQANSNAIEQIQGFAGDLFTLFAGLEPTGIDLGDLKYVIQGLGAFFGINPDTPFPMNLLDAALHFFTTYIIPLDQFTDVVFDAITSWAEELGLPPEFINDLHDLFNAIQGLTDDFTGLFNSLGDLLGAFGFLDFTSTSGIGNLWDSLTNLISGLDLGALKPVFDLLANLGSPFIEALTAIVNTIGSFITPFSSIAGSQVTTLGTNVAPNPSASTIVWSIGGDDGNAWVFDPTQSAPTSKNAGSLTTLGTGFPKRVLMETSITANPGAQILCSGQLKWVGIPTGTTSFGLIVVWYQGLTEKSKVYIDMPAGHAADGGWTAVTSTITVPANVDGFKLGARVEGSVNTGQVWVDDFNAQPYGTVSTSVVDGLEGLLENIPIIGSIIKLLENGFTGSGDVNYGSFPYSFPMPMQDTSADADNPIVFFIKNFLQLFNIEDWLTGSFNPVTAIVNFVKMVLQPTNLLAWLDDITGLLPDIQAPQILTDIILTIEGAFTGIPILGNIIQPIFDAINGLLGIGTSAQSTGNTALSAVAAIQAAIDGQAVTGGTSFVDDFNYAAGDLPDPPFDIFYFGSGSHNLGSDGDGNLHWETSGSASANARIYLPHLNTSTQSIRVLLPKQIHHAQGTDNAIKLQLRCNGTAATATDWVECNIIETASGPAQATIGYVVGGTYTQIGTAVNISDSDGDLWEFQVGSTGDVRDFILLRNNLEKMRRTDSTGDSVINDTTHNIPAFTLTAGTTVAGFLFVQSNPPDIDVVAAADRTATA